MKTDAQKKANTKYINKMRNNGSIKAFNITVKTEDYNIIDTFCKGRGISKAKFVVGACKYAIENNIDVVEDIGEGQAG